ncbi:MAG: anthranilate synthase component II [Rhodospirillaceae bacterium]
MYLLIDNYDSFTFNLWHYLGELGAKVEVCRNDKITVADALALEPAGIIISPGPCDPQKAGVCLELIRAAAGKVPMFGVCLGFQSIAEAFGGKITRAPIPVHGKVSAIRHKGPEAGHSMFADIPEQFNATRYHSLIVERTSIPDTLEITAETKDGLVMGLAHKNYKITGVQFHPESIASQNGHRVLGNFLRTTGLNVRDVEDRSINPGLAKTVSA